MQITVGEKEQVIDVDSYENELKKLAENGKIKQI